MEIDKVRGWFVKTCQKDRYLRNDEAAAREVHWKKMSTSEPLFLQSTL